MAVSNLSLTDQYDALLTTTLRNYRPTLVDNAFQDIPLYYWLKRKNLVKRKKGGYEIMVPLIYGHNNTVKHYSGYDLLDVTPQEGITTARYKWHSIAVSISISGDEEADNSGEHQLINLLEAKTMQAEKSLNTEINDNIHGVHGSLGNTYGTDVGVAGTGIDSWGQTSVSTDGFNSLDHIVRMWPGYVDMVNATARTHTVGGIQVSVTSDGGATNYADFEAGTVTAQTNSWWLNYSNPGFAKYLPKTSTLGAKLSSTELGYAGDVDDITNFDLVSAMRSMYNRVTEGTDKPDLGLTSYEVYEMYESSLVPNERFTSMDVGDAGFDNLRFKGMTIMPDHGIRTVLSAVPTSTTKAVPLYFLNSNYLEWVINSNRDFMVTPFYRPHNQDARTAQILARCQLTCSNRQRHGVISCATGTDYSS